MAASGDTGGRWESQAEVDACLRETGVTMDQVRRWRREGLLLDVEQAWPEAYHGSEVSYPASTCAQIKAAKELFETKNRVDFVGWELWWRGFPVDERHWRPLLIQAANLGDKALRIFKLLNRRNEAREAGPTIADRTVQADTSNSLYLKFKRRVSQEDLPALLGMLSMSSAAILKAEFQKCWNHHSSAPSIWRISGNQVMPKSPLLTSSNAGERD